MAIVTLFSATGSPGTTTCALGLALAWPRDVILVDADRCPSQSVMAGYLGGVATGGRGLTSLAQAYRDGIDLLTDLPSHLVPMPGNDQLGAQPQRWFLPGFARPGSARLFDPVWPELFSALEDLERLGTDVIVDAGRWGPVGLPPGMIAHTRCLAAVTRSQLRSLASLHLYLPDVVAAIRAAGCMGGLIMVGAGQPYSSDEVGRQFGLPVWGDVPWQVDDAAGLSDGQPVRPKSGDRPLARSFAVTANNLTHAIKMWDQRLGRVKDKAVSYV